MVPAVVASLPNFALDTSSASSLIMASPWFAIAERGAIRGRRKLYRPRAAAGRPPGFALHFAPLVCAPPRAFHGPAASASYRAHGLPGRGQDNAVEPDPGRDARPAHRGDRKRIRPGGLLS